MGHKRERNHYPRLPEAVLNLLALHSLEAWPAKQHAAPRGARIWAWKVTKAGENHLTSRAVFTVMGSHDLDYWVDKVQDYVDRKLDFPFHGSTQTGRWDSTWDLNQLSKLWTEELEDMEARIAAVVKFP